MATTKIVQGSDYAEDLIDTTVLPQDLGYLNWGGQWAIVDKLGTGRTTLASGNLAQDTSGTSLKLKCRVLYTDTEAIPTGHYKLVIEVSNSVLGFKREVVQRACEITAQGI